MEYELIYIGSDPVKLAEQDKRLELELAGILKTILPSSDNLAINASPSEDGRGIQSLNDKK